MRQTAPPRAELPPPEQGEDDSASLTIHCRILDSPRGECEYCDKAARYKIANGADPEFEKVCTYHAGDWLAAAGAVLLRMASME